MDEQQRQQHSSARFSLAEPAEAAEAASIKTASPDAVDLPTLVAVRSAARPMVSSIPSSPPMPPASPPPAALASGAVSTATASPSSNSNRCSNITQQDSSKVAPGALEEAATAAASAAAAAAATECTLGSSAAGTIKPAGPHSRPAEGAAAQNDSPAGHGTAVTGVVKTAFLHRCCPLPENGDSYSITSRETEECVVGHSSAAVSPPSFLGGNSGTVKGAQVQKLSSASRAARRKNETAAEAGGHEDGREQGVGKTANVAASAGFSDTTIVPSLLRRRLVRSGTAGVNAVFPSYSAKRAVPAAAEGAAVCSGRVFGTQRLRDVLLRKPATFCAPLTSSFRRSRFSTAAHRAASPPREVATSVESSLCSTSHEHSAAATSPMLLHEQQHQQQTVPVQGEQQVFLQQQREQPNRHHHTSEGHQQLPWFQQQHHYLPAEQQLLPQQRQSIHDLMQQATPPQQQVREKRGSWEEVGRRRESLSRHKSSESFGSPSSGSSRSSAVAARMQPAISDGLGMRQHGKKATDYTAHRQSSHATAATTAVCFTSSSCSSCSSTLCPCRQQQHHHHHPQRASHQQLWEGGGSAAAGSTGGGGFPQQQQQGKETFWVRALWTIILVSCFFLILAAGHAYCAALVLALVATMYREIIAVKRRRDEGRLPPDFTLLKWYWFTITILGMGVPAALRLPWRLPGLPWASSDSTLYSPNHLLYGGNRVYLTPSSSTPYVPNCSSSSSSYSSSPYPADSHGGSKLMSQHAADHCNWCSGPFKREKKDNHKKTSTSFSASSIKKAEASSSALLRADTLASLPLSLSLLPSSSTPALRPLLLPSAGGPGAAPAYLSANATPGEAVLSSPASVCTIRASTVCASPRGCLIPARQFSPPRLPPQAAEESVAVASAFSRGTAAAPFEPVTSFSPRASPPLATRMPHSLGVDPSRVGGSGAGLSPAAAAGGGGAGLLWGRASPDRVQAVHSLLVYAAAFVGLVWFILSLRKGVLRSQFSQLGVMLVALVFIVAQALMQVANIYAGLIWFVLPTSLVIANDVSAYICGKLFGRTRLIRLSPKKTVEGFIGASLVTLVFASFAAEKLQQYAVFTCPPTAIDLRPFAMWKDVRCEEADVFKRRCFDSEVESLLPFLDVFSSALRLLRGDQHANDTRREIGAEEGEDSNEISGNMQRSQAADRAGRGDAAMEGRRGGGATDTAALVAGEAAAPTAAGRGVSAGGRIVLAGIEVEEYGGREGIEAAESKVGALRSTDDDAAREGETKEGGAGISRRRRSGSSDERRRMCPAGEKKEQRKDGKAGECRSSEPVDVQRAGEEGRGGRQMNSDGIRDDSNVSRSSRSANHRQKAPQKAGSVAGEGSSEENAPAAVRKEGAAAIPAVAIGNIEAPLIRGESRDNRRRVASKAQGADDVGELSASWRDGEKFEDWDWLLQEQQTVTNAFDSQPFSDSAVPAAAARKSEQQNAAGGSSNSSPSGRDGGESALSAVEQHSIAKATAAAAAAVDPHNVRRDGAGAVTSSSGVGAATQAPSFLAKEVASRPCRFYFSPFQLHAIVLGVFAAFFAPFGGFLASGFKRAARVKDFGEIIPGHGGVTDRFDCQILSGMFTHLYYKSFVYETQEPPPLPLSTPQVAAAVAGGGGRGGGGGLASTQLLLQAHSHHRGTLAALTPEQGEQQQAALELLWQRQQLQHRRLQLRQLKDSPLESRKRKAGRHRQKSSGKSSSSSSRQCASEEEAGYADLQRSAEGKEEQHRGVLGDTRGRRQTGEWPMLQQTHEEEEQQQHAFPEKVEEEARDDIWEPRQEGVMNAKRRPQNEAEKADRGGLKESQCGYPRKEEEEGEVDDDQDEEEYEEEEENGRDLYFGDILDVVASIDDIRELELVNQVAREKLALLQEQQQYRQPQVYLQQ